MPLNVGRFKRQNVVDTCAVWNLLSSELLFAVAVDRKCGFCCTQFVYYECLYKPRRLRRATDKELCERMRRQLRAGHFTPYSIAIDDLQDVDLLEKRRRLSKGELSSIVFAKKTRQAFLTDDQKARKLASLLLDAGDIQTTPQLFGWLFFDSALTDSDKDVVIAQHVSVDGKLTPYFNAMYREALRCRLMSNAPSTLVTSPLDSAPPKLADLDSLDSTQRGS